MWNADWNEWIWTSHFSAGRYVGRFHELMIVPENLKSTLTESKKTHEVLF